MDSVHYYKKEHSTCDLKKWTDDSTIRNRPRFSSHLGYPCGLAQAYHGPPDKKQRTLFVFPSATNQPLANLLDMVYQEGNQRKIHQLIQQHRVKDMEALKSWSKWFLITFISMSYLTVCAVASPTVAPISWEVAWDLTVDYSAPTSDVTDFLSGLGNAFEQSASAWNQPEIGNHTADTLLTIDGILKSVEASDDSSKKINVVEEAVSLMTTLAIANVQYSDEEEPFTEKVADVSIFAQTVNTQLDSGTNSTTISIPNSTATVGIPNGLCDSPDECVVVFIAIANDLTASAFDNEALITRVYTINLHSYGLRRILTEDDFSSLSVCAPFLFTIPIEGNVNISKYDDKDDIEETYYLPVCQFWETENGTWSQTGCWVSSYTTTTITCGCTHLTSISGSTENFTPSSNVMALWNIWQWLDWDSALEQPTVLLVLVTAMSISIAICCKLPDYLNKPLIAWEDSIFDSFQESQMSNRYADHACLELSEIILLEAMLPTNSKKKIGMGMNRVCRGAACDMVKLHWALVKLYFNNEHTVFSVYNRSSGSNYSVKQRLACFLIYFYTVTALSAIFYGLHVQVVSLITASFAISLVAVIPGRITTKFFKKSKPKVVESYRIDQMIFHLKPNLDALRFQRSALYQRGIDVLCDRKHFVRMGVLRRFQEHQPSIDGVDWNRLTFVNQIRNRIFEDKYPFPYKVKRIMWILLVIWCISMIVITLQYGMRLDSSLDIVENHSVPDCWENNFRETLNQRFTEIYIDTQQESVAVDYGWDSLTDSQAWLLSICGSLALSIFVLQPIAIWIETWIKLWAFTHNLGLDSGVTNIFKLIAIVCCKRGHQQNEQEDRTDELEELKMYYQDPLDENKEDEECRITDNGSRPLDIYQFYGCRELLIDDVDAVAYDQDPGRPRPTPITSILTTSATDTTDRFMSLYGPASLVPMEQKRDEMDEDEEKRCEEDVILKMRRENEMAAILNEADKFVEEEERKETAESEEDSSSSINILNLKEFEPEIT